MGREHVGMLDVTGRQRRESSSQLSHHCLPERTDNDDPPMIIVITTRAARGARELPNLFRRRSSLLASTRLLMNFLER